MPWTTSSGLRTTPRHLPRTGATCLTREDVLQGWQSHNGRILARLRPGADDEFLLQSLKDVEKGFCSYPMDASALHHMIGAEHRLIPRCVITQSSGKQRVIDDAYVGLQSKRSSDANKLALCPAIRPAQHLQYAFACGAPLSGKQRNGSQEVKIGQMHTGSAP